jgi:hypothetical protein
MGAAAERPHPEYEVPPMLLKANCKLAQIRSAPYFSHQDHVFNDAMIGDKTGEVNVAAGVD